MNINTKIMRRIYKHENMKKNFYLIYEDIHLVVM